MEKWMTIDTRLLSMFLLISESKNVSQAAQKAGLTQSAISQALKRLEDDLDVKLVVRHASPVSLTAAGVALKENAEIILSEIKRLRLQVREAAEKGLKHCRLDLITSIYEIFVSVLIMALKDRSEKMKMRIELCLALTEAFIQNKID